ncbi:phosphotransferase [Nesterenkonia sedimenti]|uniref:phosphotransferase n=1 Tax=Nesterenkonia sedimenti TaxID=1463632 RepID=UPI002D21B38E|nr:phosphotransferase [Nesterenkonia sedimenti]
MRWTSMELAALATRAVPGLSPTGVADAPDDARDFMSAVVVDGGGNRWRVRGPQHAQAALRLETEVQVLRGFSTAIRAELPFRVPSVAGATRVGEMRIFVYNHLPGAPEELAALTGSAAELVEDLGRTVAAVHDLSESVVDHAELPRYSAEQLRQRRLNELDAAAATGKVPPLLLRRWEHAMEEKELWEFSPTVVHGDMHEDNLLIEGPRVVAVTGWTDLHIGDPADDLAWLIASPSQQFADAVMGAYRRNLKGEADEHILRRAGLSAEFALARWLVRGQTGENQQMVEEALGLLNQLANDIQTYGGRPIALTPMEGEEPRGPADTQDSKPVMRAGAAATIAGGWEDDDDDEPAVIIDDGTDTTGEVNPGADAEEISATGDTSEQPTGAIPSPGAGDDEPTGAVTPIRPRPQASPQPSAPAEDPPTDQLPAYVDDVQEFEEDPISSSLPIRPDARSEQRAKQKNYFPASAASAASGRSAGSAASASSAASTGSAGSAGSANSTGSAASAPSAASAEESESEKPQGEASAEKESSTSEGSIYERHPGLRPPGS